MSKGVLGAAAVVTAFVLVILMIVTLVNKKQDMQNIADDCSTVFHQGGAEEATGSSTYFQLQGEALADCATELRAESAGTLADLAGDPDELNDLATLCEEESSRLLEAAAYLQSRGQ